MKTLKQIGAYSIWAIIALLLGIGYMRIVLGPNETAKDGLWYLLHVFYDLGLLHVGLVIGVVIAVLFIFLDMVYLKKKLKDRKKSKGIRFLFLLAITMVVGVIHYILEKVIDVI
ncbi:hypothetical protein [Aquimarina rubra]|uniref:Uncharacterized protein n=1 Tax=Aquimarina rubra TaxID=1920033 RepID=A0ABW5LDE4_9FLAO